MKRTLILFASDPSAWQLQSTIAWYLEGSSELYEAFLRDLIGLMGQLNDTEAAIRYTPARGKRFFDELAPGVSVLPQRGHSERERLVNAFGDHLVNGGHAVLLWTHAPHLPAARLRDAFTRLDDGADVVLGPCEDGNVYLVGTRAPQPELLTDLPNQPGQRLHFLRTRAAKLGLRVVNLPAWYTISSYGDIQRLAEDLQTMPDSVSPHTRRMLASIAYRAREFGR